MERSMSKSKVLSPFRVHASLRVARRRARKTERVCS